MTNCAGLSDSHANHDRIITRLIATAAVLSWGNRHRGHDVDVSGMVFDL